MWNQWELDTQVLLKILLSSYCTRRFPLKSITLHLSLMGVESSPWCFLTSPLTSSDLSAPTRVRIHASQSKGNKDLCHNSRGAFIQRHKVRMLLQPCIQCKKGHESPGSSLPLFAGAEYTHEECHIPILENADVTHLMVTQNIEALYLSLHILVSIFSMRSCVLQAGYKRLCVLLWLGLTVIEQVKNVHKTHVKGLHLCVRATLTRCFCSHRSHSHSLTRKTAAGTFVPTPITLQQHQNTSIVVKGIVRSLQCESFPDRCIASSRGRDQH